MLFNLEDIKHQRHRKEDVEYLGEAEAAGPTLNRGWLISGPSSSTLSMQLGVHRVKQSIWHKTGGIK